MLEILKIKNVAIIDTAEIQFNPGLNILSGETGAGKSVVIEAISLLLGGRASAELIRSGSDEAVIEGQFKIAEIPWMSQRLIQAGFETKTPELIIKRTVHRAGRHRISVNGELATLTSLQNLCEGLIDLCGQHEHQSLLKTQTQLELLDRYGGLTEQTRALGTEFVKLRLLHKEKDRLEQADGERMRRSSFLSYQINEIVEAQPSPGEDEQLLKEKQLLQSAALRAQTTQSMIELLEADEHGVQNILRILVQKIKSLNHLDPRNAELNETFERVSAELEEAHSMLTRYLHSIDLDPERLQSLQDRLSLLADLKRKYGSATQSILETLKKLQAEFNELNEVGDQLKEVTKQIATTQTVVSELGQKLSYCRSSASELLSQSVTNELKDLKMGDATFVVELCLRENLAEWTASGGDGIQFFIQTNRGESARPIGKIASGGELSRLMLAIRRVIADRGGIGVYLFDEIDAGIGGQTAFQVGKKLKSVAEYNQVICITHLPQVASFADHHLVVRKGPHQDRTTTQIIELSHPERKEEIARMLGGPNLTRKSLENASELLELAGNPIPS
jgi:DNA repair protein RecN (Recombination protein N)